MDIVRTGEVQRKRRRRAILALAGAAAIALITLGLSKLKPAAPTVDRQTVWIDKVQRGSMLRQVRGSGTLVPEEIRWITANVDGRVERIPTLPSATATVKPDTILLELSNPEVEKNALESESQLKGGQADYDNLKAQLDSQLLTQQGKVTEAESNEAQAKLLAEANKVLGKDGLIPDLSLKTSLLRYELNAKQTQIERERYEQTKTSNAAQLAAQRARVAQLQAMYDLRRREADSLKVRAGIPGVLQELPLQVGQRATAGTNLARVARPEKLKAQLHIPETQAKDVLVGQQASIDTRNGLIAGHVARVAPSVQEGTVIVDVALDGALPQGARPDLSVDGTIEIERLENVLYVGRPAYGQANSKIEMFKLIDGGKHAVRVPVQLGRSSVNTIEIISGLNVGDEVILSDTSAQDGYDRIQLN
jgi:HlyD family secretion protein